MSDLLTPQQASALIGVPAVQLARWACYNNGGRRGVEWNGSGPKFEGSKYRPRYDERELQEWLSARR